MANVNPPIVTFTGGILGGELHNRVDVQSYPTSCEVMENFRPRLQGPMTRRPAMEHIANSPDNTKRAYLYEFVQSSGNPFLVRHASDGFTFYLDDELLEIPSVTASLSGSWTNASSSPSSISVIGSNLWLDADGANKAIARKTITTSNVNSLHILAFEVEHGPVHIRIGTTAGGRDLMHYTRLAAGVYRLAFTPTTTTSYLDFWHDENAGRVIKDNVSIVTGTTSYILPTPYSENDIFQLDWEQVRDVMYFTHKNYWPRRLERRSTYSWSIVKHLPNDGPWGDINITNITIAASNTQGEVTLTASESLFSSTDVGVLFKLVGTGQVRSATATSADVATGGIKVTGSGAGDSTSVPPGTGGGGDSGGSGSSGGGGGWGDGGGSNGGGD